MTSPEYLDFKVLYARVANGSVASSSIGLTAQQWTLLLSVSNLALRAVKATKTLFPVVCEEWKRCF